MEVYHNQKKVTITVEDADGNEPGWTIVVPCGMVALKIRDEAEDDEETEIGLASMRDIVAYREPRFKMRLDVDMEIGEEDYAYRVQYNEKEIL